MDETMDDRHQITPLGAAIVEALPDRKRVAKIKRDFRKGECPASALFTAEQAATWAKTAKEERDHALQGARR